MKYYVIEYELDLFVKQIIEANTEEEAGEKAGNIIGKITKNYSNNRVKVSEYDTHDWTCKEIDEKDVPKRRIALLTSNEVDIEIEELGNGFLRIIEDGCDDYEVESSYEEYKNWLLENKEFTLEYERNIG